MRRNCSTPGPWRRDNTALFALAAAALLELSAAAAGEVSVALAARDGGPVADAAVLLLPETPLAPRRAVHAPAQMDQVNRSFVPEVLVVETGTAVEFPNSDSVSHQVYSFSPAKRFQLPLYRGRPHAPVTFDHAGLVVLGCNIHDEMVGYIVVTDTPYHAATDAHGTAHLTGVPPGQYQLRIWSPRIADGDGTLSQPLTVLGAEPAAVTLRLKAPLRRKPSPRPGRTDWDAY